jgi:hypothetical protein
MITKLYKKSEFDLDKAQRGIVFLDGLDKIGNNSSRSGDECAQQQVFKEILRIVQGTSMDVSRLVDSGISLNEAGIDFPEEEGQRKQSESSGEYLDTSNMFFVCFGGPPDGFEKSEQKEKNKTNFLSPHDPRLSSPASGTRSRIGKSVEKNDSGGTNSSSGHYSGEDALNIEVTRLHNPELNNRQQQQDEKQGKKDPGDGPGGGGVKGEKRKDSGYTSLLRKDRDDLYDDDGYGEDEDFFDNESLEDEEAKQLTKLLEVCDADLHEANSKFSACQKMWGMKDIKFEFADGALEMIAYQALCQQTGDDGISNIIEKLFMTIKFDIPGPQQGKKVSKIEITEDSVMGKARPIYSYETSLNRRASLESAYSSTAESIRGTKPLTVISGSKASYQRQTSTSSTISSTSSSSYYLRNILSDLTPINEEAKSVSKRSVYNYTDFELDMIDQIEL